MDRLILVLVDSRACCERRMGTWRTAIFFRYRAFDSNFFRVPQGLPHLEKLNVQLQVTAVYNFLVVLKESFSVPV